MLTHTQSFPPPCLIPTCRYGCEKKPGKDTTPVAAGLPVPGSIGGLGCVPARHQERIFPLMLALNAPDLFSYRACNFKVQKSKAGTGRVVGFRELGLVNAYTMEASFAGAAVGKYAKQHFNAGGGRSFGAQAPMRHTTKTQPLHAPHDRTACTPAGGKVSATAQQATGRLAGHQLSLPPNRPSLALSCNMPT